MKLNIIREYWLQETPDPKEARLEMLMEVDSELLDVYRSETGDYGDTPDQEEFDEWINGLIRHVIEGEDWIDV